MISVNGSIILAPSRTAPGKINDFDLMIELGPTVIEANL